MRGQTRSDSPATSTPSSVVPVGHTASMALASEAGIAGMNVTRATSADPASGATGGNQAIQVGSCAKATQADLAA